MTGKTDFTGRLGGGGNWTRWTVTSQSSQQGRGPEEK